MEEKENELTGTSINSNNNNYALGLGATIKF